MAAGATYEPITTQTVSTPAATITFTSIPATYTDLRVVMVLSDDDTEVGTGAPIFRFNGDTAGNYSQITMHGDSTSGVTSQVTTSGTKIYALYWNNSPTSTVIYPVYTLDILNYAGANYKSVLVTTADDRNGTGAVERHMGVWLSTSAITQLDVTNDGNKKFETGSIITLYGIKAA